MDQSPPTSKKFGPNELQDGCLNQANFITIAMERMRQTTSPEVAIYQAAKRFGGMLSMSPQRSERRLSSSSRSLNRRLSNSLRSLYDSRDESEEIIFDDLNLHDLCRIDIELKDFETDSMSRESFRSFQSFSEFLKGEAKRRSN